MVSRGYDGLGNWQTRNQVFSTATAFSGSVHCQLHVKSPTIKTSEVMGWPEPKRAKNSQTTRKKFFFCSGWSSSVGKDIVVLPTGC